MLMATAFSKNDALILTFNLPVLFLIGIFTYFSWYKPFGPVSSFLTTSTLHKKYLNSCERESTLITPKPFLSLLVSGFKFLKSL